MTHPSPSTPSSSRRRWWIAPSVLVLGLYAGFFAFAVAQACPNIRVTGNLTCMVNNHNGTYTAWFGYNNSGSAIYYAYGGPYNLVTTLNSSNKSTGTAVAPTTVNPHLDTQLAGNGHQYAFSVVFNNAYGIQWRVGESYTSATPADAVNRSCSVGITETATPTVSGVGQSVTFTAPVTTSAPSGVTPPPLTGSVAFTDENNHLLTPVTRTGNTWSVQTSSLPDGSHHVTATYANDSVYAPVSAGADETVDGLHPVLECVTNNHNGTYTAHFGYLNDFTGTNNVPVETTGVSNYFTPGPNQGQPTSFLTGRQYDVFQVNFNGSNLVWNLDNRTSTASSSSSPCAATNTTTIVSSSLNPSVFGQSVTFTAYVTASPSSAGIPTGTVNFVADGNVLGPATLDSTGHANYTTGALSVGSHPIVANYVGEGVYPSSSSSPSSPLTQVVNQIPTGTDIVSSVNPSVQGQDVTFTATVHSLPPVGDTPPTGLTGTLTFKIDGVQVGTPITIDSHDQASIDTSALTTSSPYPSHAVSTATSLIHLVTVSYSGDVNYKASGNQLNQEVDAVPPVPTGSNNAYFRIAQSANLPASADVAIDGNTSLPGLQACSINNYNPLNPGSHTIAVGSGGKTLFSQSITFTAGDYYTLAFVDDSTAKPAVAPNLVVFQDDLSVSPGMAKARVYHLNDSAGPVSVAANGTVVVPTLSFEQASSYFSQNPGVESYAITLLNTSKALPIDSINEAANQIYGIFVMNNCTTNTVTAGIPTALPQTGFAPIPSIDWNAIAFFMGALAVIGAGVGGASGLAVVQYRRRHR